jgi:alginate O-acetyltransferase complex protein AlgI
MLFSSFTFVFGFLPLTLLAYWLARNRFDSISAGQWVILVASFAFIAAGTWLDLSLLLISLVVNWLFLILLARSGDDNRKIVLVAGLIFNLGFIAIFKYADLLADTLNDVMAVAIPEPHLPLPLAISFYTFQLIALLVENARHRWPPPQPKMMALFFSFFPHLLAGPLLWFHEVRPQLERLRPLAPETFLPGMMMLSIGMFKKAVLADSLAPLANGYFAGLEKGASPGLIDAWSGTLAYTFQIYFDFSGYSDMAVGLALLFGIALPVNFYSPYKAASVIDFWRRWHMTLSRFLREYLYIPLGGNRRGAVRRWVNLMLTMTIGGLWHGASWNFALWGGTHGLMLAINHAWRGTGIVLPRFAAWMLTFVGIVFCWVLFRTQTVGAALSNFAGLLGINGIPIPASYAALVAKIAPLVPGLYISGTGLFRPPDLVLVVICGVIALGMPNSEQLIRSKESFLLSNWSGPAFCGVLATFGLMAVFHPVPFIYFRF